MNVGDVMHSSVIISHKNTSASFKASQVSLANANNLLGGGVPHTNFVYHLSCDDNRHTRGKLYGRDESIGYVIT